ncbi:hypothetical protein AB0L34_30300 [Micromonospora sp. NPDC052213]|uniref:hypothetical protein n=1 Tax=Micromonospora sp. NPDC052213 TaxID=3155812 RepID=UPI003442BF7B
MEKILKDVSTGWGIKHKAQEERRKRKVKEAIAAVTTEMEAAGVKIVKRPRSGRTTARWRASTSWRRPTARSSTQRRSRRSTGTARSSRSGTTRPARFVCLDPEAQYKRTGHSYYKTPAEIAAKEAKDKAAQERRERMKAAASVRRRFLVEKYGSAKGAKTLLVEAMRFAVVWPDFLQHRVDGELIKELAGGTLSDGLTAGQDRLNRLLVARLIAAQEHNFEQVADGRWSAHKDLIVLWLNRLEEDGYELSEG